MKMNHFGQNGACSGAEPHMFQIKISGRKFVYEHIESAAKRKQKWSGEQYLQS